MTDKTESLELSEGAARFMAAVKQREEKEAANREAWQAPVRGYLVRAFADLSQLKHRPKATELVQYILQVYAKHNSNNSILEIILPFTDELSRECNNRMVESRTVEEFREWRRKIAAGKFDEKSPIINSSRAHLYKNSRMEMENNANQPKPAKSPEDLIAEIKYRKAVQEGYAKNKAEWQAELRLKFQEFMQDWGGRHHAPEPIEIVLFLLELSAENIDDYDLLALVLSFAERLPYELRSRQRGRLLFHDFMWGKASSMKLPSQKQEAQE